MTRRNSEIDRGIHSKLTGVYYVKCDAVNCCKGNKPGERVEPKKWDIGQTKLGDKIEYLGKKETKELYNKTVEADTWLEEIPLPFTKLHIKYTYYISTNGSDTITHRIDFNGNTSNSIGAILYGDFQVQHDIESFRDVFRPPSECLARNVDPCAEDKMAEWDEKYNFN
eukprot:UC4_evm2s1183